MLDANFSNITLAGIDTVASTNRTYLFGQSGYVSKIIEIGGINDSGFSASEYNKVYAAITAFIQSIDSMNTCLQFTLSRRERRNIPQIEDPKAPIYITEANKFLIDELVKKGQVFDDKLYIAIVAHPDTLELSFTEVLQAKFLAFKSMLKSGTSEEEVNNNFQPDSTTERISRLDDTIARLVDMLGGLKVEFKVLNTENEIRACYSRLLDGRVRHNPATTSDINFGSNADFRASLVSGGNTSEYLRHFLHDDRFAKSWTLDYTNPETHIDTQTIKNLLNLPCEFNYTVSFKVLDYTNSVKKLESRIKNANLFNEIENPSGGGKKIVENLEARRDLEATKMAREMLTQNAGIALEANFLFTYFEAVEDVEDKLETERITLKQYSKRLESKFQAEVFGKIQRSTWSVVVGPWANYCRSLPGCMNLTISTVRVTPELPDAVVCMLPVFTEERLDLPYYGFNHLFNEQGKIIPTEVYDPKDNAWTSIFIGVMGVGKSVTNNKFLSYLETKSMISGVDPLIRIIDYGGHAGSYYKRAQIRDRSGNKGTVLNFASGDYPNIQILDLPEDCRLPTPFKYKQLANLILADYPNIKDIQEKIERAYKVADRDNLFVSDIGFSTAIGGELGINPKIALKYVPEFRLKVGECEPNQIRLNFIMNFLKIMLSPNDSETEIDYTISDIIDLVYLAYRNTTDEFPTLTTIYDLLKISGNDRSDIAKRLKIFTEYGPSKFFTRKTSIDLNASLLLFDMAGLEDNILLNRLYTMAIVALCKDDCYKKQDRTRYLLVDECQFPLRYKEFRSFIVECFKTSRKYQFAVSLATQTYESYFKYDAVEGEEITGLATNLVVCGFNRAADAEKLGSRLGLSRAQVEKLKQTGIKNVSNKVVKKYNQFAIIKRSETGDSKVNLYNNYLSPFEYELYSSSKQDNAIVKYFTEEMRLEIIETINIIKEGAYGNYAEELIEYLERRGNIEASFKVKNALIQNANKGKRNV